MRATQTAVRALGALLWMSTVAFARAQTNAPAPLPANIEVRAKQWLRDAAPFGITGAIAILRDTTVTLLEGFGPLTATGGVIGPDTPFLLASLSKQFTATAVVSAVAHGKLALSDSLAKFFPDAPAPQRNITVQQLLTHTSGMVYLEPHMFDAAPDRSALMHELIALPLDFAPGARWSYSSPGYAVLAGVLERAEGRSFENILRDDVFKPAGMTATTFMGVSTPNAPHGVQLDEDQGPMETIRGADRAVGNGSVISTVRDLARWEVALRTHRVLDARWTAELFTPRVPAAGGAQFAYGWNVLPTPRGTTLLYHAGDLGPFNTEFRRYVDDKFTLIWLSNARLASGGTRSVVTRMIAGLINGTPVVMPPRVAASDAAQELRVAGNYRLPSGDTLFVDRNRGAVRISASGSDALLALAGGVSDTSNAATIVANALSSLLNNDNSALRALLHPSLSPNGAVTSVQRFLTAMRDSLGAPVRFESVGSTPTVSGSATVWVRMRGTREATMLGFGTVGGRIMSFANPTAHASPLTLHHSADNAEEYVWFDAAAARTLRVRFDGARLELSNETAHLAVATRM